MIFLLLLLTDPRIIDGDTFEHKGEIIRIANIDTPETGGRAECDAERMLGDAASDALTQILAKPYTIIRDGTDRYGRTLATIEAASGEDVGELLIERQLAVEWSGRRHDWCG